MDVSLKRKFIPQIHEENTNINTTLFIFLQIVSENVSSKKLRVKYLKRDGESCIFDGVQDLLKSVSIEVELTPMDQMEFYDFSMLDEPPHIVYIDDLIQDPVVCQAMLNTVPPSSYVIGREVKNTDGRLNEDYYLPLYRLGKGEDSLELARWMVHEIWRLIESRTRISTLIVRSEADLEEMEKSLNDVSMYHQLIIVTNYPDQLGIRERVLKHRMEKKQGYAFVVLTNSEVDEKTLKSRIKSGLMCSILNDGIWGGEYYVPTAELTSN